MKWKRGGFIELQSHSLFAHCFTKDSPNLRLPVIFMGFYNWTLSGNIHKYPLSVTINE